MVVKVMGLIRIIAKIKQHDVIDSGSAEWVPYGCRFLRKPFDYLNEGSL